MNPQFVIFLIIAYFGILIGVSLFTSKEDNAKTFFTGNRNNPWYLIAFGMIGTSISGVTFISVPGAVGKGHFGYMMVVLGYWLGYFVVAKILLPLYYKRNLTSIYQYLAQRFGITSYKTGAVLFLISRLIGSSLRLCVVAVVLNTLVFAPLHIPFWVSVAVSVGLIYVYTFQSGVKTVIWTDTIQTVGLLAGLFITIAIIMKSMQWSASEAISQVTTSEYSQLLFTDWQAPNFFVKTFLGGAAITIAMTGLDQDMMQKNLACRTLADAQKNMYWFSFTLVIINLLFVGLGAMMYLYATKTNILSFEEGNMMLKQANGELAKIRPDDLFPMLANNYLGSAAAITFVLGVIAAAYSSADSAMTALTTSFCVDILNFENRTDEAQKRKTRYIVHLGFAFAVFLVILYFYWLDDNSLINKVLDIAGYTYGPLVGLFSFGILTSYNVKDKFVPFICLGSAFISYLLKNQLPAEWIGGYKFGIEILIVNGILTYLGLMLIRTKEKYVDNFVDNETLEKVSQIGK
jgi:Na+/proline symporter